MVSRGLPKPEILGSSPGRGCLFGSGLQGRGVEVVVQTSGTEASEKMFLKRVDFTCKAEAKESMLGRRKA